MGGILGTALEDQLRCSELFIPFSSFNSQMVLAKCSTDLGWDLPKTWQVAVGSPISYDAALSMGACVLYSCHMAVLP